MGRFLIEVAGAIIALALIVLLVNYSTDGQHLVEDATKEITETTKSIAERDLTKYDGVEVTGSDVVNAIRQFKDELTITVDLSGTVLTFNSSSVLNNLPSSPSYVNPSFKFIGSVTRDANGSITVLTFTRR